MEDGRVCWRCGAGAARGATVGRDGREPAPDLPWRAIVYVVVCFVLCRCGFVVLRVDGVYSFLVIEVRRRSRSCPKWSESPCLRNIVHPGALKSL